MWRCLHSLNASCFLNAFCVKMKIIISIFDPLLRFFQGFIQTKGLQDNSPMAMFMSGRGKGTVTVIGPPGHVVFLSFFLKSPELVCSPDVELAIVPG